MTELPNQLVRAVAEVMATVQRLGKGDENKHGGYKYTSADDFKDAIRPLLASHGLDVRINETDWALETLTNKDGKPNVCARFTFEIRLRHVSGIEDEPERTTILLSHTGAQTTGAAKTYALKEWLKGRFLISTGEKDADADSMAPQDYSAAPQSSISARAKAAMPKAQSREPFAKLQSGLRQIESVGTIEDLRMFWTTNKTVIAALPEDWCAELTEQKDDVKAALQAKAPQVDVFGLPPLESAA